MKSHFAKENPLREEGISGILEVRVIENRANPQVSPRVSRLASRVSRLTSHVWCLVSGAWCPAVLTSFA